MEDYLKQGIAVLRAGDRQEARRLFALALEQNRDDERVWGWMYNTAENDAERLECLTQMLQINPQNEKAQALMENMKKLAAESADVSTPQEAPVEPALPVDKVQRVKKRTVRLNRQPVAAPGPNPSIFINLFLILCVGWLYFKTTALEKNLTKTQEDLRYVTNLAENANNYAHTHDYYSDIRLKKDVTEIQDSLAGVRSLTGVNFYWDTSQYPVRDYGSAQEIGFIAQDVEKIFPQLVHVDRNGYKTLEYEKLVPVLVEAIKEQQLMIEDLQQKVQAQASAGK